MLDYEEELMNFTKVIAQIFGNIMRFIDQLSRQIVDHGQAKMATGIMLG